MGEGRTRSRGAGNCAGLESKDCSACLAARVWSADTLSPRLIPLTKGPFRLPFHPATKTHTRSLGYLDFNLSFLPRGIRAYKKP